MSNKNIFATGGCACGHIRYELSSDAIFVHCCHCRFCQRHSGSAFALNAMIEADRVSLTNGQPEKILVDTPSGKGQKISRCPNCRTAVWSNYGGAGDLVHFVRVGSLDDPDLLPPDIHIFTNSKQPWVVLSGNIPAVPEYYNSKEMWPIDSQERMTAAMQAVKND